MSEVLPIPCTKVEGETVKDWFQKINEELDELKDAIISFGVNLDCPMNKVSGFAYDDDVAEEAADTITTITSMLEAMGIDEDMRQEAQRRVNEKNRERGRFFPTEEEAKKAWSRRYNENGINREKPKENETWWHFKGKPYTTLYVAKHTETGEELVIYKDVNGDIFARPLSMFMSEVDREKYPDARQKYRFERLLP